MTWRSSCHGDGLCSAPEGVQSDPAVTLLAGKTVLVTGAARGMGAAEAFGLATAGANVVAVDIRPFPNAPEHESILQEAMDVTSEDAWHGLVEKVVDRHGTIEGLVNNAGIASRHRLLDVTSEDLRATMSVNVEAALLGIQAVSHAMPSGGSIVNIGSIAAWTGHYATAYTISKWALRGLARVASLELGPRGIRVNTIHPGYIETEMTLGAPPAFAQSNLANIPLGRPGGATDIVPLVVYLISDGSSFVSGAEIAVDGGQYAHGGAKTVSDAMR